MLPITTDLDTAFISACVGAEFSLHPVCAAESLITESGSYILNGQVHRLNTGKKVALKWPHTAGKRLCL